MILVYLVRYIKIKFYLMNNQFKTRLLQIVFLTVVIGATQTHATAQNINTIAGNGTGGYSGDGAAASTAEVNTPWGLAVDGAGNILIADAGNSRIRKINAAGVISTIAGTGTSGFAGDGGQATAAQLSNPQGIAVDGSGNIFVADAGNNRIRKIAPSGVITTYAGTGTSGYSGDGAAATAANLASLMGIDVDAAGNLYVPCSASARIRKVSTTGIITTIAGTGTGGFSGDGGPATAAKINGPVDVVVDIYGGIYFTDQANHRVRLISGGTISTVAGTGASGDSGDGGAATAATFTQLSGIDVDNMGDVFVSDWGASRVRMIDAAGNISTYTGTGAAGFAGDGGAAATAQISHPEAICHDPCGNYYIADRNNNRIRKTQINNHPPSFAAGAAVSISLCQGAGAQHLDSMLSVNDVDAGQPETWAILTAPSHGTTGGFPNTQTSTGGGVSSVGLVYTPATGYSGTDSFKVTVSDCFALDTIVVRVNVTALPTAGTISGIDSICPGYTTFLSSTVAGGTWYSANTTIATVTASGAVWGSMPGNDVIKYVVSNSCGTDTASYAVVVRALCADGVQNINGQTDIFGIYPNPNKGEFNIALYTTVPTPAKITITDIMGNAVQAFDMNVNSTQTVQLNVSPGIYLVTATTGNGKMVKRILVQ